jgi:hypothetical protein
MAGIKWGNYETYPKVKAWIERLMEIKEIKEVVTNPDACEFVQTVKKVGDQMYEDKGQAHLVPKL